MNELFRYLLAEGLRRRQMTRKEMRRYYTDGIIQRYATSQFLIIWVAT